MKVKGDNGREREKTANVLEHNIWTKVDHELILKYAPKDMEDEYLCQAQLTWIVQLYFL